MDMDEKPEIELFISDDMRPVLVPNLGDFAPLPTGASVEDLKKQALEVLEFSEEDWLLRNPQFQPSLRMDLVVSRKGEVTWNSLDEEMVLLDLETSRYYTLNRVGAVIWEMLDGSRSLQTVADCIEVRFDAAKTRICDDLLSLIGHLSYYKLIHLISHESGNECVEGAAANSV